MLRRPTAFLLALALFLGVSGCANLQLRDFEAHVRAGNDLWVVEQPIDCTGTSATCARLYLIQGDAGLRLAEQTARPSKKDTGARESLAARYAFAADTLETGLARLPAGFDATDHQRYQERFCTALAALAPLQPHRAAEATLARLEAAAQGLYQLAPESVPAIFYLGTARLLETRHRLPPMHAAEQIILCERLKRTLNRVLSLRQAAEQAPLPHWPRLAADLQRLAFDMGLTLSQAGCR